MNEQAGIEYFLSLEPGERGRLCGLFREMLGDCDTWEEAMAKRNAPAPLIEHQIARPATAPTMFPWGYGCSE